MVGVLLLGQRSRWYASPKSMILGTSCLVMMMLVGLRSRWTMLRLARKRMPRTMLKRRKSLVRRDMVALCRRAKWSSGSPLTYSISKQLLSSACVLTSQYLGMKWQQLPCMRATTRRQCYSLPLRRSSRPPLSTFIARYRSLVSGGRRQTEKSWEETKERSPLAKQMRLEPPSPIGLAIRSFSYTYTVLNTKSSIFRSPTIPVSNTLLNLCLRVSLRWARLPFSHREPASFQGVVKRRSTVCSRGFQTIIPSSNILSWRRCYLRTAWLCPNCMRSSEKSKSASVCMSLVRVRSSWREGQEWDGRRGRRWSRRACRRQIFLWMRRLQMSIQGRLRRGTAGRSSLSPIHTLPPSRQNTASLLAANCALTSS